MMSGESLLVAEELSVWGTWGMLVLSVLGGLFVLWRVLSVLWVAKDSASRIRSGGWQVLSIVLVVVGTPLVGLPVYLILRPVHHLVDCLPRRESLLVGMARCPSCLTLVCDDDRFCVSCGGELMTDCRECSHAYSVSYDYCPACGAPHLA